MCSRLFYFLKHLQQAGLMKHLKAFAKKGGVLVGLSAGALIMSPTIRSAGEKDMYPDPNEVKLKNLRGLNLFPFEFSPHYDHVKKEMNAHLKYSKKTRYPVFAVKDGSGVIIRGKEVMTHGKVFVFQRGKLLP